MSSIRVGSKSKQSQELTSNSLLILWRSKYERTSAVAILFLYVLYSAQSAIESSVNAFARNSNNGVNDCMQLYNVLADTKICSLS